MSQLVSSLAEAQGLFNSGFHEKADLYIRAIIDGLETNATDVELRELKSTIDRFQPRRQRLLSEYLDVKLLGLLRNSAPDTEQHTKSVVDLDLQAFDASVCRSYADLSKHNIFDWNFAYLSTIRGWFNTTK